MSEAIDNYSESRAKWPVNFDDYELGDVIGRGATAVVQAATIKKTDEHVAVKRINLDRCNTSLEEILKEIQVMERCQHENVVRFYTSFVVGEELWLIMKLLYGGSLLDVIRYTMQLGNCHNGVLDEVAIATVLREVIKGLDYFHSNGHMHRDIKAGNILLGTDGSVQIADFGVSAFIASGGDITHDKQRHTFVGTPCWMAPEVMEQQPTGYNTKVDIWSFGILAIELATGTAPYHRYPPMKVLILTLQNDPPTLDTYTKVDIWSFGILAIELATGTAPYHRYPPMKVLILTLQNDPPTLDTCAEDRDQYKHYSKIFRKMIEQCLQKNPDDRATAKQLLKHDFFKKAKDRSYIAKNLALKFQDRKKMEEKIVSRRKLGLSRVVRVSDNGEWKFSSGSEDENSPISNDEQITKIRQLEDQTVQNIDDLIEKNDIITQSVQSPGDLTVQMNINGMEELSIENDQIFKLTLRIRNAQSDLHDIKFDVNQANETVEDVTSEMVSANLIDERDTHAIISSMKQLIENPTLQSVVFTLESYIDSDQPPDDKQLLGFAQLSLDI
ncbi:unnamed protein product [Adineta steineri]|uniref:non-specific serine/threonine protein kinase n=1 Tax=Adineta steineri TaxID=433720 RepID=A0A815D018_9BILA|nr:unnamed protein product [Adineta steineri]